MPDLNGYWEGKLTSLTYQTTMDMKLEVKQQWSKINFYATFPESTSSSNVASIFIERDGKVTVGFGFINHSRELPQQYDGYNILEIDDDTHLFGRYLIIGTTVILVIKAEILGLLSLVKLIRI